MASGGQHRKASYAYFTNRQNLYSGNGSHLIIDLTNNNYVSYGKPSMNILDTLGCRIYPKQYYKKITIILPQTNLDPHQNGGN